LDISENGIGDSSAIELAEALKKNSSLHHLRWDKNDITLKGWEALNESLQVNKTLYDVPDPQHDVKKCLAHIKEAEVAAQVGTVLDSIVAALKSNLPKITSVKSVACWCDQNPEWRESMEVSSF
jgi:hypothetical protein